MHCFTRSIRHFLLFDRGDMMHQLIENMEAKLNLPCVDGSLRKEAKALAVLLDETIRSSSLVDDPHRANVRYGGGWLEGGRDVL